MKTITKMFWDKSYTKKWLRENTTFKYPETITERLEEFTPALENLGNIPIGNWVWKPNTGRQSMGVMLFERTKTGIILFPDKEEFDISTAKIKIRENIRKRIWTPRGLRDHRLWFVEKWIHPHERFWQFTDDSRCPPIIRLCGRPKIHFIGMSPMLESRTGISAAGWQDRKYIWVDLGGTIRSLSEMNLANTDKHSINVAKRKSLNSAPIGEHIAGIREVVDQINKEIAPKIKLYKDCSWSCDGIFDKNNEFIVLEMNHAPGLQFKGFKW